MAEDWLRLLEAFFNVGDHTIPGPDGGDWRPFVLHGRPRVEAEPGDLVLVSVSFGWEGGVGGRRPFSGALV